jgi:hypothetical protein
MGDVVGYMTELLRVCYLGVGRRVLFVLFM